MTDYARELLTGGGAAPSPQAPAAPRPATDYAASLLSGGAEMRAQPAGTRMPRADAPSVVDTFAASAPFGAQVAGGMTPDVNKQIRIYANQMGIPETKFGVIDGNVVYHDDASGEIRRVTPSVAGATGPGDAVMRALQWIGSQLGPSIPGAVGAVTGIMTAPKAGGVPGAAAGAAAGDVVRQGIGNYLAGSSVSDLDGWNVAGQAAMGGAGQAGGALVTRAFQRNPLGVQAFDRAAARDPAKVAESEALVREARARGVDLSAGQATGLRSLQQQERQLGRFPETADQMQAFAERQRLDQVPRAINEQADQIAALRGGEEAIESFRRGGEAVVKRELDARKAAAAPVYRRALDERTDRFWNEQIDQLMSRPSVKKGIAYAKLIAAEEGKDVTVPVYENGKLVGREFIPDWRSWDYIKRGIDRVIEENTDPVKGVNAYGRTVANTKRQLLGFLDKANPDYKIARAMYGDSSDGVDAVLNGGVGLLQKMKGPERQAMVDNIFGGRALMPEEVGRMRGLFVEAGKRAEWDQGVRQFIAGKLDAALKMENPAQGFFKAMEKDPAQRRVLRAAIGDSELVAGWENLMRVLDAARKGLPEGSPTVTDLQSIMGPQTVGRAARVVGAATSPQTYLNAGNLIVGAIDELRTPAARMKLADALLNPDAVKELRKLRTLPPGGPAAVALASRLLVGLGIGATGATEPSDRAIPGAPSTQPERP